MIYLSIHITLRTEKENSFFRKYFNAMLELPEARTAIISSGYYKEKITNEIKNVIATSNIKKVKVYGGKNYWTDLDGFFKLREDYPDMKGKSRNQFTYFREINNKPDILDRIKKSKNQEIKDLEKNVENDLNFLNFYKQIASLVGSSIDNAELKIFKEDVGNWHAKILIVLDDTNTPLAGIIGSSNLTIPAYGEMYSYFNYESDVMIFNKKFEDLFENIRCGINLNQELQHQEFNFLEMPIATKIDESVDPISEIDRLTKLVDMLEQKSDMLSV